MAQINKQIKAPEKELSDKEIDNLFDAEFKTLVIRMLTELIELGHKMKELDMQVQDAQRVPKKLDLRRNTPRQIIIILPKIKDKERILKAAREKGQLLTKEFP